MAYNEPAYGDSYSPSEDYNVEIGLQEQMGGPVFVYYIMLVFLPVMFVSNLLLFIETLRAKVTKEEPWRWMVGHMAFCLILKSIFMYDTALHYAFQTSSAYLSFTCPLDWFSQIVTHMSVVSLTLIVIERYHALRTGKENGGFDKMAVVTCLIVFWLASTLATVVTNSILPYFHGHDSPFVYYKNTYVCAYNYAHLYIGLVLHIWMIPTMLVVFIGMLVLRNKKTTTDDMKKSIVNPTIALSAIGFLFVAVTWGLGSFRMFHIIAPLISYVAYISLPMIWLVTWSRNGDISLKCCRSNDGERRRLLNA